jgi:hypothetical protein
MRKETTSTAKCMMMGTARFAVLAYAAPKHTPASEAATTYTGEGVYEWSTPKSMACAATARATHERAGTPSAASVVAARVCSRPRNASSSQSAALVESRTAAAVARSGASLLPSA